MIQDSKVSVFKRVKIVDIKQEINIHVLLISSFVSRVKLYVCPLIYYFNFFLPLLIFFYVLLRKMSLPKLTVSLFLEFVCFFFSADAKITLFRSQIVELINLKKIILHPKRYYQSSFTVFRTEIGKKLGIYFSVNLQST